ncbi:hypothetical protein CEUSTIGMA_g8578.t1 [Chlamydomonas eustigma]|uniref:J domain-containing protein n=1 Tax=Chlamydomonas eustigma TaxID=1157962 RepID=A0A250XDI4_9CHLO|nr:hypothetical protein CEUSTIGMA_g8578.t1 [Chlamydomonas eustigma]|eukprot:GAX81145.1 hypothetical protein CEUSTIGMA_g8578.t1 [Chlamydomonas eustigma]
MTHFQTDSAEIVLARVLAANTPWDTLGVSSSSSYSDARLAFKRDVLLVHPDKARGFLEEDERRYSAFQKLKEALSHYQNLPQRQGQDGWETSGSHMRRACSIQGQRSMPSTRWNGGYTDLGRGKWDAFTEIQHGCDSPSKVFRPSAEGCVLNVDHHRVLPVPDNSKAGIPSGSTGSRWCGRTVTVPTQAWAASPGGQGGLQQTLYQARDRLKMWAAEDSAAPTAPTATELHVPIPADRLRQSECSVGLRPMMPRRTTSPNIRKNSPVGQVNNPCPASKKTKQVLLDRSLSHMVVEQTLLSVNEVFSMRCQNPVRHFAVESVALDGKTTLSNHKHRLKACDYLISINSSSCSEDNDVRPEACAAMEGIKKANRCRRIHRRSQLDRAAVGSLRESISDNSCSNSGDEEESGHGGDSDGMSFDFSDEQRPQMETCVKRSLGSVRAEDHLEPACLSNTMRHGLRKPVRTGWGRSGKELYVPKSAGGVVAEAPIDEDHLLGLLGLHGSECLVLKHNGMDVFHKSGDSDKQNSRQGLEERGNVANPEGCMSRAHQKAVHTNAAAKSRRESRLSQDMNCMVGRVDYGAEEEPLIRLRNLGRLGQSIRFESEDVEILRENKEGALASVGMPEASDSEKEGLPRGCVSRCSRSSRSRCKTQVVLQAPADRNDVWGRHKDQDNGDGDGDLSQGTIKVTYGIGNREDGKGLSPKQPCFGDVPPDVHGGHLNQADATMSGKEVVGYQLDEADEPWRREAAGIEGQWFLGGGSCFNGMTSDVVGSFMMQLSGDRDMAAKSKAANWIQLCRRKHLRMRRQKGQSSRLRNPRATTGNLSACKHGEMTLLDPELKPTFKRSLQNKQPAENPRQILEKSGQPVHHQTSVLNFVAKNNVP